MATTSWSIDPAHSEIQFKVRHLMITNVSGSFGAFTGGAETEGDNFDNAKIHFSAEIASIDTSNPDRDTHLRSADFFDAEKYPKLSFESTGMKKTGDEEYKLTGNMTIRDVTKAVTFDVETGGTTKDPWGNTKAGFSLSGKINRKEFGLTWNAALETGGVMVSEEVKLMAEIQLVKAVPAQS